MNFVRTDFIHRFHELTEWQDRVLWAFAVTRGQKLSAYDISKLFDISYKVAHRHRRVLESFGFIEFVEMIGFHGEKMYKITAKGKKRVKLLETIY